MYDSNLFANTTFRSYSMREKWNEYSTVNICSINKLIFASVKDHSLIRSVYTTFNKGLLINTPNSKRALTQTLYQSNHKSQENLCKWLGI